MNIKDFEKEIQATIDPDLTIRVNPNHKDIAGVYYKDVYISIAVPPEEIREEHDSGYRDDAGYPYKHRQLAIDLIKGKLPKYKKAMEEEPELFSNDIK